MSTYVGLYTHPDDSHLERIQATLKRRQVPFVRFDRADFPQKLTLTASLNTETEKPAWHGSFWYEHQRYFLEKMKSILYRRPSPTARLIDGLSQEEQTFAQAEARKGFDGVLRNLSCLWVNPPDALQAADWKPRQLREASALGFRVPKTLITNDPAAALRFFEECEGRVIYKPLSAPPTIRSDPDADQWSTIYTTKLTRATLYELASKVAHTAHLFQQEIVKEIELRVTLFGTRVFATALHSQASSLTRIDWRRSYDDIEYSVYNLPKHIQRECLRLLSRFQLKFAALDLAVTPEGEFIFFECNSNGQWMWVETMTGQPLTEALVDLLTNEKAFEEKESFLQ